MAVVRGSWKRRGFASTVRALGLGALCVLLCLFCSDCARLSGSKGNAVVIASGKSWSGRRMDTPLQVTTVAARALEHGGRRRGLQPSTAEAAGSGRRYLVGPGSYPPRCVSKCGACSPCKPVHVPVPPGNPVIAEYYPEAWRCQCDGKLYLP